MGDSAGCQTQRRRVINEIRQFKGFHFTAMQLAVRTQFTIKQTGRVCCHLKSKGFLKVTGKMKIDGESSLHNVYQITDKFYELSVASPLHVLTNSIIDLEEMRRKRCDTCSGCPHHDKKFPNLRSTSPDGGCSVKDVLQQCDHLLRIFRTIVDLLVGETSPEDIESMRSLIKIIATPKNDLSSC